MEISNDITYRQQKLLENFNTDGIESDNPLEKIKQNKQKSDEKKKTFKKFF